MEVRGNREKRWISGVEPRPELLSATGTEILELECREQPRRLQELIRAYADDPEIGSTMRRLQHAARLLGCEFRNVDRRGNRRKADGNPEQDA